MGLFGTRAGLLVDLFLLLLLVLPPAMLVGVALVRRGRRTAHAAVMRTCFALFLAGLAAFEVAVQFGPPGPRLARLPLWIHLFLAVPCLLVWIRQIATSGRALENRTSHRRRGLLLLALLSLTVATGFWLYAASFLSGAGSPSG